MSKQSPDESGVHEVPDFRFRLETEERLLRLPETTRKALEKVEKLMGRMTVFFRDMFYERPHNLRTPAELTSKIADLLIAAGIQSESCHIGHMVRDVEGVKDDLIMSTPRGLVLFHCEPQEITKPHPFPVYPELKFVHPQEGVIIQPQRTIHTLNLGKVEFRPNGVFERRDYPNAWDDEEFAAWDQHKERWDLPQQQGPAPKTQSAFRTSIGELLRWKKGETRPQEPHSSQVFVPYTEFQRRLQNIAFTLESGLHTINSLVEQAAADGLSGAGEVQPY